MVGPGGVKGHQQHVSQLAGLHCRLRIWGLLTRSGGRIGGADGGGAVVFGAAARKNCGGTKRDDEELTHVRKRNCTPAIGHTVRVTPTRHNLLLSALLCTAPLFGSACLGQQSNGPEVGEAVPSEFPAVKLELVADALLQPLYGTYAPGQADHLYVLEKAGRIKVVDLKKKHLLEPTFLDIRSKVSAKSERGLLGLAFAPDYVETGIFYIHYSDLDGKTIVARMQRSKSDLLQANAESEEMLLTVEQPWANHDGGQLCFGPDGMLYLGLGDGGAANDPNNAGQNGKSLLGKILRLKVSSTPNTPYQIPDDNPFVGDDDFRDEIWCYGLRNPWRFSFDRKTGDLWIGDVGQNKWEEVDFAAVGTGGGMNFGWRVREAAHDFNTTDPRPENMVEPIHEYAQGGPRNARSVTGGYVYRGKALPGLTGWYVFGDYVSGQAWVIRQDNGKRSGYIDLSAHLSTGGNKGYIPGLSSFAEDSDGELYWMSLSEGKVYRIVKG